jgi:hypothetical protein
MYLIFKDRISFSTSQKNTYHILNIKNLTLFTDFLTFRLCIFFLYTQQTNKFTILNIY